jgi:lipoyl(octanoyl) transferase
MSSDLNFHHQCDGVNIQISENFVDYQYAVNEMSNCKNQLLNNNSKEFLWLLEHNHLYTGGSSANNVDHIKNIPKTMVVYYQSRGGQFTYHGPGQRVVYFCIDIKKRQKVLDLHKIIYLIEEIVILSLGSFNLNAKRINGKTGIWTENQQKLEKICAIGVNCSKGIITHGFAINICNDLKYFDFITPCGIEDKNNYGTCSISSIFQQDNIKVSILDNMIIDNFENIFLKNL